MKKIALLFLLTLFMIGSYAQDALVGVWYNTTKSGKVEIFKKGDHYFGKIIWLEEPISEKTGKPKVDENNPDKDKRTQPIIGLVVLKDFENDGNGKYVNGTIYDPENGKTYKCKMTLVDNNNLDVRGYVGIPAFGRTENWTRAK